MPADQIKTIISISSHVMRGSVGNRASAFALEILGHPVWSVPTIVLPWHPGQGASTRLKLDEADFTAALSELANSRWHSEVGGAMTGYFASAGQVRAAADLIRAFRQADHEFIYLCDPVIGDSGGLYVAEEVACAIRDELLPLASIATPNRFELGWLADMPVESNAEILKAAHAINVPAVITTSAHAMMAGSIANLLVEGQKSILAEHRALDRVPNGLGDLFSATFLSHRLNGQSLEEALRLAVSTVFEVAARSVKANSDELLLEKEAQSIKTPMAMVAMRSLALSPRQAKRPVHITSTT